MPDKVEKLVQKRDSFHLFLNIIPYGLVVMAFLLGHDSFRSEFSTPSVEPMRGRFPMPRTTSFQNAATE